MKNRNCKNVFKTGLLATIFGSVLGVLFAKKSGKETREDIKEKFEETKDKAVDLVEKVVDEAKEIKENLKEDLEEIKESLSQEDKEDK